MTMRSKQWYTKTSRLETALRTVPSVVWSPILSRQLDHRLDGRWNQNFKYLWLVLRGYFYANPLGKRREIRVTIRMCAKDHRVVSQTARSKGYANPSAFIREAIRNEFRDAAS
jgi:hypothetical protein